MIVGVTLSGVRILKEFQRLSKVRGLATPTLYIVSRQMGKPTSYYPTRTIAKGTGSRRSTGSRALRRIGPFYISQVWPAYGQSSANNRLVNCIQPLA